MTSGMPGSPKTAYFLIGSDPLGQHLWLSRDYIRVEGAVAVNNVSAITLYLPGQNYSRDDFPIDGVVELWRSPIGQQPTLFLERLWFIRERYKEIKGGQRVWKIVAYDLMYILGDPGGQAGRVIAYNAANAFTSKLDEADNMCKAIVRENLGTLATDTDRDLSAYLSVEADTSLAPIVRKEFARRVVLAALQEIAQASFDDGTYLAFDIVCVTPPSVGTMSFEFRTYTGQRGQDHRSSSGDPILLGPDFGNMDNIIDGVSHTTEHNYVYVLGDSVGDVVAVLPAFDLARIGFSPFNRREYVQNADSTFDLEALQNEADAALKAGRPQHILSGTYLDTDQARFGEAWGYGDYLTSQVDGESFDCRNEAIGFTITLGQGEELQIALRADDE